jgi:NADPH:quinone reductase
MSPRNLLGASAIPLPVNRNNELFDAIATGTINVTVGAHYPLKDAAQAHRDLESRRTVGSVVLTP